MLIETTDYDTFKNVVEILGPMIMSNKRIFYYEFGHYLNMYALLSQECIVTFYTDDSDRDEAKNTLDRLLKDFPLATKTEKGLRILKGF